MTAVAVSTTADTADAATVTGGAEAGTDDGTEVDACVEAEAGTGAESGGIYTGDALLEEQPMVVCWYINDTSFRGVRSNTDGRVDGATSETVQCSLVLTDYFD